MTIDDIKAFLNQLILEGKQANEAGNVEALADLRSISEPLAKLSATADKATKEGLKIHLDVDQVAGEWKKVEQTPYKGGDNTENYVRGEQRLFVVYIETKEIFAYKKFAEDHPRDAAINALIDLDRKTVHRICRAGEGARTDAIAETFQRIAQSA